MRKMLKIFATNLIVLNSSIMLVACKPPSLAEVWIITDGGDLFDKAFNQQVLEGSKDFSDTFNQKRAAISALPGFGYWKNNSVRTNWIISKDGEISTLQNNYNIASYAGAKTIVCAGFHHLTALTAKIQKIYQNLGVRFILIDSLFDNPVNLASLTYAAEQSSFLAALAGAIWLVAHYEEYGANGLKMSTFGGVAADTIVEIMIGYFWGVYYFNYYKDKDPEILVMINKIRTSLGRTEFLSADLEKEQYKITFNKIGDSFSRSFESGSANAKAITSQLINKNENDIVFPVAGAQTTDLISTIVNSKNNNSAKIIGVDVDQSKQYEYAKDYFLTSALKGIRNSVDWMLWNSFDLTVNKETGAITYDPNAERYFNGEEKYSPLKGKDYNGISNSPQIKDIYDILMNEEKYWNLADRVVEAFDRLASDLANNSASQKWEDAWQNLISDDSDYRPDFDVKNK